MRFKPSYSSRRQRRRRNSPCVSAYVLLICYLFGTGRIDRRRGQQQQHGRAQAASALLVTEEKKKNSASSTSSLPLLSSPSSSSSSSIFPPSGGPIDDAKCNIEDLEKANDSQLHSILHDLKQTAFFRNFVVNLKNKCPLRSWRQPGDLTDSKDYDDDDDDDSDKAESSSSKSKDTSSSSSTSSSDSTTIGFDFGAGDEEDEVTCTGGQDELDEGAEPLCTVQSSGFEEEGGENDASNLFGGQPASLESKTLSSFAQEGFQYRSQLNTFAWNRHRDLVVTEDKGASQKRGPGDDTDTSCGDSSLLPDEFWMDMCKVDDGIDSNNNKQGREVVNLLLNPERNTGYNGTHIWKAIYDENCLSVHDDDKATSAGKQFPTGGGDTNKDMCYEERVLYRLLSGLHTQTTLSIAINYFPPSKRKGRPNWEASPDVFMDRFEKHPEYIRDLHFSYVVLLRALSKAAPFLGDYEIRTGNIVEDETATVLLHRLLDSRILGSCSSVFGAFDESLMFNEESSDNVVSLQQNFKGVFHNITSILDCVQCQQCKLHGKLTMLGYGAALKVLFMQTPSLERNEIVALINTIAKFSESIRHVRELTNMYWERHEDDRPKPPLPDTDITASDEAVLSLDAVDKAVQIVSKLGIEGLVGMSREEELVKLAFQKQPELLILAKHYGHDLNKFLQLLSSVSGGSLTTAAKDDTPDAVIVGTGLAGLAAALNILDRGGKVVLIEKEHLIGGNSNKASSGINGCCLKEDDTTDTLELFKNDTLRSAGTSAKPHLIDTLVGNSAEAVTWLKTRAGVDLSLLAQLGGHSAKRTHRPNNGMAGAEIIYAMQKAVKEYKKTGRLELLLKTKVIGLLTDDRNGLSVTGVKYVPSDEEGEATGTELKADNVILATGGFAADRSVGSFLSEYRPELLKMPTTAGEFSTGDGISLATNLGAGVVDMDKVQLHPTGWVDPKDPSNKSKVLAAELMRGVGGVLLNDSGQRFCNELGTRSYVTDMMLKHNSNYAKTGKWDPAAKPPSFYLILSSAAAEDGKKHVELYSHKGFLTRVEGAAGLAKYTGMWKSTIVSSLKNYEEAANKGEDQFGKKQFRGAPKPNLDTEVFYVGKVTPVLHYCMGGITIDAEGRVLKEDGTPIAGLFAAGEVSGGVHGVNRLGGNSLLECTVYGTIVGKNIPVKKHSVTAETPPSGKPEEKRESKNRVVSYEELQEHSTPDDCWVAIHDVVYDFTEFADEHPAGPGSIHELAGKNGTEAFAAVHNPNMMDDFDEDRIGILSSLVQIIT